MSRVIIVGTGKLGPGSTGGGAVDSVNGHTGVVVLAAADVSAQPVDGDLTTIAALTPSNDDVIQRKAGAWTNRTIAQLLSDLGLGALYQPLDSDLTAIGLLSTTSYGRALLTHADQAALTAALAAATTSLPGIVELATSAETITGTDTVRANTPAGGAAAYQALAQATNAQTGTTYTLVAGDVGKLVTLSNGSAITLTVPQDSDATIAVGIYVDLYQLGAGQVTVVAGSGATLRVSGLTAKARAQYSRLAVQKVSANTWSLFGDLAAS